MLWYEIKERMRIVTAVINPAVVESPIIAKLSVSLMPVKRLHLSQCGLQWPVSISKKKSSRQITVKSECDPIVMNGVII